MRLQTPVLFALALTATPAFAAKPQIQWNEAYDFSSIDSFSWKQSPASASLERSDPFLHNHIVNAIEFQLTSAGLTETQSGPDVLVTYYGSTDTEVRLQSDTYGYGWGGYGTVGWGRYGYGSIGPVSTTTRVTEYERGTLVVDIVDAASQELIWRGTANGIAISDTPAKTQKNVTKAIEKMAKQSSKLRGR